MRTTTSLLVGAAMFASAVFSTPQSTNAKIVFIDGDSVLTGSEIGRVSRERLEAEAVRWQETLNEQTAELEALQRQRQDQALTLNEAALARLNQDIEEKQVLAQRTNDDARRELERMEQQITIDVNEQLGPLVERFAADNGYDVIFDSSRAQGVLYFANSTIVTTEFLALVNSSVGTSQKRRGARVLRNRMRD